jgi:hypothetical protein
VVVTATSTSPGSSVPKSSGPNNTRAGAVTRDELKRGLPSLFAGRHALRHVG